MLPEGVTATLEDGPSGVRLNDGILTWDVPHATRRGVKEILVNFRKKGSEDEILGVIRVIVK